MKITIKYLARLGDVIRCFPLAKHYHDIGHDVEFMCLKQYHDIFRCITYAKPVSEISRDTDKVIELDIWKIEQPNDNQPRYNAFRESRKKWVDFIYDDYPEVEDRKNIELDAHDWHEWDGQGSVREIYRLPERYNIIAPCGHSQIYRWSTQELLRSVNWHMNSKGNRLPTYFLGEGIQGAITARKLYHLPHLIRNAEDFFCINSAPSIIAGAIRDDEYFHYCEPSFDYQDDHDNEMQIKIKP